MKCALCGGAGRRPLPFRYRWEEQRFGLSRCRHCSLIAVDPLPAPETVAAFYGRDYFETGLHGLDAEGVSYLERMRANAERTRRFVAEHILVHRPGAASLFEIGAATGHLLAAARDLGVARVSGLEISPHAAALARSEHGLELHVGDVADFDPGDEAGSWDVVYAGDVLEHVRDPLGFLDTLHALAAPGGVVVVRIPTTFDLLSSRLAGLALTLAGRTLTLPDPPYHLHEFTRSTAHALFERRFDDIRLLPDIVPASSLNTKGGGAGYRMKQWLQLLNVPVTRLTGRFGDRLTIVAGVGGPRPD